MDTVVAHELTSRRLVGTQLASLIHHVVRQDNHYQLDDDMRKRLLTLVESWDNVGFADTHNMCPIPVQGGDDFMPDFNTAARPLDPATAKRVSKLQDVYAGGK